MDLNLVSFPILVIADDGWVAYFGSKEQLREWTGTAIRKYNKRRVLLFDDRDYAWKVESIIALKQLNFLRRLHSRLGNTKQDVQICVQPITEAPIQAVHEILQVAIDADDDILTQDTEADVLKSAVSKAVSFKTLVDVLKKARAIDC